MINFFYKGIKDSSAIKLKDFRVGCWINVFEAREKELKEIAASLSIESDLLLDALDVHEVPRMEYKEGVLYLFTRVPFGNKDEIFTVPLLIVLGENFVMTISREKNIFLDDLFEEDAELSTTQKTKLFLKIFLRINKEYNNHLININKKTRGIKIMLEKISSKDIIHFVDLERIVNDFISALVPTNAILQKVLDGKSIRLYEEDRELMEDLFLENVQLIEISKASVKNIFNIRDAYSNIMTHELNKVMKILTSLTILLAIPTMIFSFYGMNVSLPESGYHGSYLMILIFSILLSVFLIGVFVKKRWL